jgi:glycerol-3-phosphate dehydrogenase
MVAMWEGHSFSKNWRDAVWSQLDQKWDLIVIGGGITGAGILREAVRAGLRTLLVEQKDFASGTSSRSSKLVHGGLRYLKNGQVRLTMESVHERELLLHERRGLVTQLGFLLADYDGDAIPGWVFGAGLVAYDLLALQWGHRHYDAYDMHDLCPALRTEGLQGGYRYFDAQTDDACLVLRLIEEAVSVQQSAVSSQPGGIGLALNYARVTGLLQTQTGQVVGVALQDEAPGGCSKVASVQASVVINATGAWADEMRSRVGGQKRLRQLRGSHLIFPAQRLPLSRAVSFLHPRDGRPIVASPWEGVALLGTTDVDLNGPLSAEPSISAEEVEYLLQAAQFAFPIQELSLADVQSTFAGVRPVVNTGKADPSKESREHVIWNENGMLTVTGGKLTTFRRMALAALQKVRGRLPRYPTTGGKNGQPQGLPLQPNDLPHSGSLSPAARLRLAARHGAETAALLDAAQAGELEHIGGSAALWAELRWAARAGAVIHLDDLLLRRVRLGLLMPHGGLDCMPAIRSVAQAELGWDDERWESEELKYSALWERCYHCCS